MNPRFDLEPLRPRVVEWLTAQHDHEAADIVRDLAALMGIGQSDIWTVEVHDTLRYDGGGPFVYVVQAPAEDDAQEFAALWHRAAQNDDPDVLLSSHQGFPNDPGPWEDLRGKTRADIDGL
ncbi:hypothetical protein ACQP25_44600 (plasmid) [Microtetraspora malaysiensis]|uniref:hypothetical protein n=1 Tax=Microtetraspora malaysiensis TaxID=161358 RepID=UPI003D942E49